MSRYKILTEKFDRIDRFCETINEREPNKVFKNRTLASATNSKNFTQTENYSDAEFLLQHGYKEGCENLSKIDVKNYHGEITMRNAVCADVVGFSPIVPNVILGLPKSMLRNTLQPRKTPVMHLFYSPSACWRVTTEDMVFAAKKILSAVRAAELNKIRVELHVVYTGYGSNTIAMCGVKLKDFRQPLDILKISYPLVHPSMLRRHFFRWLETFPELEEQNFVNSYGKVLDEKRAKAAWEKFAPKNSVHLSYNEAYKATEDTLTRMLCGAKP